MLPPLSVFLKAPFDLGGEDQQNFENDLPSGCSQAGKFKN
jgi:hypothetical protein